MTLGTFLLLCRNNKGLRQKVVASALGVTPTAVSRWEHDQDESMLITPHFPGLADLYDVSINEMWDFVQGKSNETERGLAKDPSLSKEQRDALLVLYGTAAGRDSLKNVSLLLIDPVPNLKTLNKSA
jgi:transcriptional regulator with XRE-family HTH domain